jgi:putative FmdB family regulatory protein
MPIYEYICQSCEQHISIWFRSVAQADTQTALCTECGSADLVRLMSQVSVASGASASASAGTGAGAASASGDASPQALAQMMRSASGGKDMGSDFREVASRLEKGESATKIEQSLRKRVGESMQAH